MASKKTCKRCDKQYDDDPWPDGREIPNNGVTFVGYGSGYDLNIYRFSLEAGWYCYACLDDEILQGRCQQLVKCKDWDEAFDFFYPTDKKGRMIRDADGYMDWGHHNPELKKRLIAEGLNL